MVQFAFTCVRSFSDAFVGVWEKELIYLLCEISYRLQSVDRAMSTHVYTFLFAYPSLLVSMGTRLIGYKHVTTDMKSSKVEK